MLLWIQQFQSLDMLVLSQSLPSWTVDWSLFTCIFPCRKHKPWIALILKAQLLLTGILLLLYCSNMR